MENINKRIRAFRKLKGITQQQLANQLEISVDILGAIERGNRKPDEALLKKISESLEIDINELKKQK
ncbi:helix-turn-helix domain-containing protein [Tepidibacillus sp. LV47]|uniref:helix-turn-helix domain-containing protein n=1 Tax=Tepidibacillus sp. LV47 TaxID=3398228 RepID=UPI003AB017B2